jgi:hypothetical protein
MALQVGFRDIVPGLTNDGPQGARIKLRVQGDGQSLLVSAGNDPAQLDVAASLLVDFKAEGAQDGHDFSTREAFQLR